MLALRTTTVILKQVLNMIMQDRGGVSNRLSMADEHACFFQLTHGTVLVFAES